MLRNSRAWMRARIGKYVKSEKGQGMVEYGLIIALIAVVVVVALTPLGTTIRDMFSKIAESFKPGTSGTTGGT